MNKITKLIAGVIVLASLTIGVISLYNINHLYNRIAELEDINSQQYHRIVELENK